MTKARFRSAYAGHVRQEFNCEGPSMAKSDMAAACDVNNIMSKYLKTGLVDHVAKHNGDYGEFYELDYHTAMNAVVSADQMFMELPAETREEFQNDPGRFLEFTKDPNNLDRMRELGLAPPERPADPSPPPLEPPPRRPCRPPSGRRRTIAPRCIWCR